jgi:hypothetical protein
MSSKRTSYKHDVGDQFEDELGTYTILDKVLDFFKGFITPLYKTRFEYEEDEISDHTSEVYEWTLDRKSKKKK